MEEAYGLLTELGSLGWDVDVVAHGSAPLVLTASKHGVEIKRYCGQVTDAALSLYAAAGVVDFYLERERVH